MRKHLLSMLLCLLPSLVVAQQLINCAPATPCDPTTGPAATGTGYPAWKAFGIDNQNATAAWAWTITCVAPIMGCSLVSSNMSLSLGVVPGANGGSGVNNGTWTQTYGGNLSTAGPVSITGAFAFGIALSGATNLVFPPGNVSVGYLGCSSGSVKTEVAGYTTSLNDNGLCILLQCASACAQVIPANASVAYNSGAQITWINPCDATQTATLAVTTDTYYLFPTATARSVAISMPPCSHVTATKTKTTQWHMVGENAS